MITTILVVLTIITVISVTVAIALLWFLSGLVNAFIGRRSK